MSLVVSLQLQLSLQKLILIASLIDCHVVINLRKFLSHVLPLNEVHFSCLQSPRVLGYLQRVAIKMHNSFRDQRASNESRSSPPLSADLSII
jgi:hypothetical protein